MDIYHVCYEWDDGWLHGGKGWFLFKPDHPIGNYSLNEFRDLVSKAAWDQFNENKEPEDQDKGTIVIISMSKL